MEVRGRREECSVSSLIVEVTTISEIKRHPAADKLEIAVCRGWQCVVGKGQFVVGDKVVYMPVDTVIPQELSDRLGVTQYLSKQRIRCARLRGEPSFGLVIKPDEDWPVGTDVSAHYGAIKWEAPIKLLGEQQERDHALFPRYTDIENIRNYPDVFKDGEMVWCSEKLHGCLARDTTIYMADGTKKTITKVKEGELVMGVDESGALTPSRVIRVFNNGKSPDGWMRIKGRRVHGSNGNHYWTLNCTPSHEFYNSDTKTYVAARNLRPGDHVLLLRQDRSITPAQLQVFVGKRLGEGFLKDPLNWVADELEEVHRALPFDFKEGKQAEKMGTLIDMIRFIDDNRNLLMPKKYTEPSSPTKTLPTLIP